MKPLVTIPNCLFGIPLSPPTNEIPKDTQPMIPAHDCSALRVFAGIWQSPANL